jgi:hypothetical protein
MTQPARYGRQRTHSLLQTILALALRVILEAGGENEWSA